MIKRFCHWYLKTFHPGDDIYWKRFWDGGHNVERFILERADKHPDYDKEKIWEDLIR
jgi:hypothetical protein